jgi:hypothetical protein
MLPYIHARGHHYPRSLQKGSLLNYGTSIYVPPNYAGGTIYYGISWMVVIPLLKAQFSFTYNIGLMGKLFANRRPLSPPECTYSFRSFVRSPIPFIRGLSEWRSGKIDVRNNISAGHLGGRGFDSRSNSFLM